MNCRFHDYAVAHKNDTRESRVNAKARDRAKRCGKNVELER